MSSIKKVSIFLMLIGDKKGQSIIELMDNSEIKAVVSEFRRITEISQEIRESVWAEFSELGYEVNMKPSDVLMIMRLLFKGGKIGGS